jgi:hypothetical protein
MAVASFGQPAISMRASRGPGDDGGNWAWLAMRSGGHGLCHGYLDPMPMGGE